MSNISKTGLNHSEARTPEQIALMQKIEKDGVCPFCAEYFTQYHPKPILKETDYWFVTENMSPYKGTTTHLIFVYKPAHINTPADLLPEGAKDLFDLVNWAVAEFNIEGGGLFMRFGDTNRNGGSVEHLHAQLLTGIEKDENTTGLKVKLAHKNKT